MAPTVSASSLFMVVSRWRKDERCRGFQCHGVPSTGNKTVLDPDDPHRRDWPVLASSTWTEYERSRR